MKGIRQVAVAAVLGVGLVGAAQAHVFVGVGLSLPVEPIVRVAPLLTYAPPPYYAPPPPMYAQPIVAGYWGHPRWGRRYYYGYHHWH